jgi:hypothetical protein
MDRKSTIFQNLTKSGGLEPLKIKFILQFYDFEEIQPRIAILGQIFNIFRLGTVFASGFESGP